MRYTDHVEFCRRHYRAGNLARFPIHRMRLYPTAALDRGEAEDCVEAARVVGSLAAWYLARFEIFRRCP